MEYLKEAKPIIVWRGYDYYLFKHVSWWHKVVDDLYKGEVVGSNEKHYQVEININEPKASTCTCPYATGKKDMCKHMVALYFTIFPESTLFFRKILLKYFMSLKAEDDIRHQHYREIEAYVDTLSYDMLKVVLVEVLFVLEKGIHR